MKVDFKFNHPCRVGLAPGRVYSHDRITVLEVSYRGSITPIYVNDVPNKETFKNLNSSEFETIMMGVKQVAEYIKTTQYAVGRIAFLEGTYNTWQKWCQDNAE